MSVCLRPKLHSCVSAVRRSASSCSSRCQHASPQACQCHVYLAQASTGLLICMRKWPCSSWMGNGSGCISCWPSVACGLAYQPTHHGLGGEDVVAGGPVGRQEDGQVVKNMLLGNSPQRERKRILAYTYDQEVLREFGAPSSDFHDLRKVPWSPQSWLNAWMSAVSCTVSGSGLQSCLLRLVGVHLACPRTQ